MTCVSVVARSVPTSSLKGYELLFPTNYRPFWKSRSLRLEGIYDVSSQLFSTKSCYRVLCVFRVRTIVVIRLLGPGPSRSLPDGGAW